MMRMAKPPLPADPALQNGRRKRRGITGITNSASVTAGNTADVKAQRPATASAGSRSRNVLPIPEARILQYNQLSAKRPSTANNSSSKEHQVRGADSGKNTRSSVNFSQIDSVSCLLVNADTKDSNVSTKANSDSAKQETVQSSPDKSHSSSSPYLSWGQTRGRVASDLFGEDASEAAEPWQMKYLRMRATQHAMQKHVISRYGNARTLFRQICKSNNGKLSFEELSAGVQKIVGEGNKKISEKDLKLLYDHTMHTVVAKQKGPAVVVANADNGLAYSQFTAMFDAQTLEEGISKEHLGGNAREKSSPSSPFGRSTSNNSGSVACVTPRTYERVTEIKEKLIARILQKHAGQKLGGVGDDRMLLNAFRQMDRDGSGFLTKEDLISTFSSQYLDIDVPVADLHEMLSLSDIDKDGIVSYKEFLDFLAVNHSDPKLQPFEEARARELSHLEDMINSTNAKDPRQLEDTGQTPDEELEKQLAMAASRSFEIERYVNKIAPDACTTVSMMDGTKKRVKEYLLQPQEDEAVDSQKSEGSMQPSALSTHPPTDKSPTAMSGAQLISQLSLSERALPAVQIRPRTTDWSRIGYGGEGAGAGSASYLPPEERYRPTTAEAFASPTSSLVYERKVKEASLKHAKLQFKSQKLSSHETRIASRLKLQENVDKFLEERRIRGMMKQRHQYYKIFEAQQQRVDQRFGQRATKSGGLFALRMQAGSPDFPLNNP